MKQQQYFTGYAQLARRGDLNEEYECRDDFFYEEIVRTEIAKINTHGVERR